MKKMIFSMAVAVMPCACGSTATKAEAQSAASGNGNVATTDAQSMGFRGNVKYSDPPQYLLSFSRIGFDSNGYVNEFGWNIENGMVKDVKKDSQGRLSSFVLLVDECDEEMEYPTTISRDAEGRISKILYQDVDYIFEYDGSGRVAKVTYKPNYDESGSFVYAMEYDADGKVVKMTRSYPDGTVDTHRFDYNFGNDANGNWLKRVEHLHQNGEDWDPRTEERTIEYY